MFGRNIMCTVGKKKIVLIGGVGNQLFMTWRALSYAKEFPELLRLTPTQKKLTSLIGWSIQEDWLGIDIVAEDLGLTIRNLSFQEFAQLFFMFVLRKLCILKFDNKLETCPSGKWDLGYFQNIDCVKLEVLPKLVKSVSDLIPLEQKNEFTIIHDRAGDFDENRRLPVAAVEKFLDSSDDVKRVISAHSSDRFKKFINLSSDEVSDLNEIRSAKTVIMTCSTFAFWGVMMSRNPKLRVVYSKKDNLSEILTRAGKHVEYLD